MLPYVTLTDATDFLQGALLLVDKPKGWTSFDVVQKIRNLLRRKYGVKQIKVGHSGTLDPMATGLLLICTGKWTRELHNLQGLDKRYDAEALLGIETDTYDAEGRIVAEKEVPGITAEGMRALLETFKGEIEQFPPVYSAIKKDGKPLYALARAGQEVKPEARKVTVYDVELIAWNPPVVQWHVHSGSGFYVRSMAHDLGQHFGCGAHLTALRRTTVGGYSVENAYSIEEITRLLQSGK